jgi:hypothetical protein
VIGDCRLFFGGFDAGLLGQANEIDDRADADLLNNATTVDL